MTDRTLRDLLHDRVSDLTMPDLSGDAWTAGKRIRRHRLIAVASGSTVAMLAAVGGAALWDASVESSRPPITSQSPSRVPTDATTEAPTEDPTDGPTSDSTRPDRPDTTYAGIDVWWSPTAADEATLPWMEDGTSGSLPRTIDLAPGAPGATPEVERAVAVFALFAGESLDRVVILAPDGSGRSLEAGRLGQPRDEFGNAAALLPTGGGLSPDGRHAAFTQNSSIRLYEFATGTWRTIDVPDWLAEGARWLDDQTLFVPTELGGTEGSTYGLDGRPLGRVNVYEWPSAVESADVSAYGPAKVLGGDVAQTSRLDGPVQPLPGAATVSNPEALVIKRGERRFALAFPDRGRSKGCCPVAGWLDADTVAFESNGWLLAWRVGTHVVERRAVISGWTAGTESFVVSWARLDEG